MGDATADVPNEVYKNFDEAGEGDKWWEAVDLQKLILAHNNIEKLKEDLRNLPLLTVLNVSHNKLSELPAAIGELHMLKSLDVSFNSIMKIPDEIGSATALVKFDCSSNQLKELPSSLGRCLNLSDFKASNNCITSLPEDLADCSKMSKLDVEGNKLTVLSNNLIASWTMLTELIASKNLLNGMPETIGSLSHLIRLDLHQNRILSIPSSISGCCSLAEFYMGNNALSALPAELGKLSKLGTLDLHSNQLKEYCVEACQLRLSVLDLSNNSLSGLPPEIGKVSMLYVRFQLRIRQDDYTEKTVTYWQSFANFAKTLILSRNKIKDWPDAILTSLSSLSCLKLDNNPLRQVPSDGFKDIPMLQILDLSYNIASLPENPPFSSLPHLQELYLRRMQLREAPTDILRLQQLQILDLSQNSLQSIPEGFKNLTSLTELDLSDNNISALPPELGLLEPSLQALRLDGNPLRSIRRTILDRGTKAVLKYLKDKIPEN
ncbi:Leucine-rich repeat (LRR) family protein [Citrus sinensis]|nr:Leucine-rich repeat (LRR) family protein [Citrus sinensis]